jgi:hypothetical protein
VKPMISATRERDVAGCENYSTISFGTEYDNIVFARSRWS